ncbi:MAG: hypothetical protein IT393_03570 [Nitrospirae bacterium]|nr:hypothetical protein [Nitrospirota bacterium]
MLSTKGLSKRITAILTPAIYDSLYLRKEWGKLKGRLGLNNWENVL